MSPILDQLAGFSSAAVPVPAEHGGGFTPAVHCLATGTVSELPGWRPTESEAIDLARNMLIGDDGDAVGAMLGRNQ